MLTKNLFTFFLLMSSFSVVAMELGDVQTPEKALFDAINNFNLQGVKSAIEANEELVDAVDSFGRTPLLAAASNSGLNCIPIVQYLIGKKANLYSVDQNGNSVIHLAAMNENAYLVKVLIESGCEDSLLNYEGICARNLAKKVLLFDAVNAGRINEVRFMIEPSTPINSIVNKRKERILHRAVLKGHYDIVRFLVVDRGADLNVVDCDGNTVLHHLAGMIEPGEIMNFLLKFSPDVNKVNNAGLTPLQVAFQSGSVAAQLILMTYIEGLTQWSNGLWKKALVIGCGVALGALGARYWYARRNNISFLPKRLLDMVKVGWLRGFTHSQMSGREKLLV